MFASELPQADTVLLSNVLHDWDVPECRQLVSRCANSLSANGRLLIHDVLLNDELDGPLPIALYSAALFQLTEGRAYSRAEFQSWLNESGLSYEGKVATMLNHQWFTMLVPDSPAGTAIFRSTTVTETWSGHM